ncbi:hypothetical protein QQZ08_002813 [Neonectria magnoliae]|uniref:Uncharacterized protein n=1 Tax=Neonectria magnoliae TaxID=2732573 RepID=A0ABR1IBY4_9HYPO
MNTNLLLPRCNPFADAGFLIMKSEEYVSMSGSNIVCTTTVLLEIGMIGMKQPVTTIALDTAAELVQVTAECEAGTCKAVSFDVPIDVPGLGTVNVDVAWAGIWWYAIADAAALRVKVKSHHGPKLVEIGERVKRAVQAQYVPVHPENSSIRGVTNISITEPL